MNLFVNNVQNYLILILVYGNIKKKCFSNKEVSNKIIINENIDDYKELVMKLIVDNQEIKNIMMNSNKELLKENQELKKHLNQQGKQITDLIPLIGNNNNNIKQKFNINVFLNEKSINY